MTMDDIGFYVIDQGSQFCDFLVQPRCATQSRVKAFCTLTPAVILATIDHACKPNGLQPPSLTQLAVFDRKSPKLAQQRFKQIVENFH